MMDDLIAYLKALKDYVSPMMAGLFALVAAVYKLRGDRLLAREQRRHEQEKWERDDEEKARTAEHGYDVAQSQNLTMGFKALMDGYEGRVRDLTTDLQTRNADLRALHDRYDALQEQYNMLMLRSKTDAHTP